MATAVAELNGELEGLQGQPVFRLSSCVVLDVRESVQTYTDEEYRGCISSCRFWKSIASGLLIFASTFIPITLQPNSQTKARQRKPKPKA